MNEITQERPSDKNRSVWRKFLKTICKPKPNHDPSPDPRTDPRPKEPRTDHRFTEPRPDPRRFLETMRTTLKENEATTTTKGNQNTVETGATLIQNKGLQQQNGALNKVGCGTFILKYWDGVPYRGILTNNTGKYYKILYEDNDEEELNHTEVIKYKKKNREEGRMTGEIGQ